MGEDYVIGQKYPFEGREYQYRGGDPSLRSSWRWIPTTDEMKTHAKGLTREVAQGVTFNFADEIESAVTGQPQAGIQAERDAYAESGGPTIIPQMAGAMVPGTGTAKLFSMLPRGIGALRSAAALGSTAAAEGAVAGAGAADPGARRRGAAAGAAIGGLLGGVVLPGAAAAGSGVRNVYTSLRRPNPQGEAVEGLFEHLARGLRPGQQFSDLPVAPGETLADVTGRRGRLTGRRALRDDPDNTDEIVDALTTREAASLDRVSAATEDLTGLPSGKARTEHIERIRSTNKAEAEKLYEGVDAIGVVQDPEVDRILADIAKYEPAKNSLDAIRRTQGIPEGQPLTARALRLLKRSITGKVNPGFRPGGVPDDYLKALQDELKGVLDDALPGYKEANRRFAQRMAAREAAEKLAPKWRTSLKADDIRYEMGRMGGDAKEEFTYAVATDLEGQIVEKMTSNPRSAFNWLDKTRNRLEAVFGKDKADDFFAEVASLRRQHETFMEADAGARAAEGSGIGRESAIGNVLTAIGYAINKMYGAAVRTGIQSTLRSPAAQRAVSQEVANLLYQAPAAQTLQQFTQMGPFMQQARQQALSNRGLLAGLGGYAGGLLGSR